MLNRLFVLDKGFVALVQSQLDSKLIAEVRDELFGADVACDKMLRERLSRVTVAIKCPLFVARSFAQYDLDIVHAPQSKIEAFEPSPGDIGSGDHSTDVAIADDIKRTTAALIINPKAYQSDGCDRFISQLITPISVYTTILVSGPYSEWDRYCSTEGMPQLLAAYQNAIKQILKNEWKVYG
jgi:hypothetical protein